MGELMSVTKELNNIKKYLTTEMIPYSIAKIDGTLLEYNKEFCLLAGLDHNVDNRNIKLDKFWRNSTNFLPGYI